MRSRCLSRWVARAVISALGSLLPAAVSSCPSDDDRMLSVGRRPRWPFSTSGSIAARSPRPAPPRARGAPVSRSRPLPGPVHFTARVRAAAAACPSRRRASEPGRARDLDERARGGPAHLRLRRSVGRRAASAAESSQWGRWGGRRGGRRGGPRADGSGGASREGGEQRSNGGRVAGECYLREAISGSGPARYMCRREVRARGGDSQLV